MQETWAAAVTESFETDVLSTVSDADVFLDDEMAEILHWTESAPELLLRAGAVAVRRFSSFERSSPGVSRAVFLLASPLTDVAGDVIRDLVDRGSWRRLLLLTSLSPYAHALAANPLNPPDPMSLFPRWTERIRGWAGCHVDIRYLALVSATILPRLWLLPAVQGARRDWSNDVAELQIAVDRLNSLLEALKVREEIFAVGRRANTLATDLVNYGPAKIRRKGLQQRAAVVIMDRCLDLVSLCGSHTTDSPLDQIFRRLPQFTTSLSSDVAVDLQPLSRSSCSSHLPAGCLAGVERKLLLQAASWRQKEAVAETLRRLIAAAGEDGVESGLALGTGRPSPGKVVEAVRCWREEQEALWRRSGLLQLALAVGEAGGGGGGSAVLVSAEKTMIQQGDCGEEQEEVLIERLRKEAEEDGEREMTFEEAVGFAMYAVSLIGPSHELREESWTNMTVSLTQLLCEEIHARQQRGEVDEEPGSALMDLIFDGRCQDIDGAPDAVRSLIRKLRVVQKSRGELKDWRSVVDTSIVPKYRPLVTHVASQCTEKSRTPSTDLAYLSTGFKDLFKSGLSYFVQTTSPHPSAMEGLLLLVVLGPVSWAEYRTVAEIAENAAPRQQLVLVTCGGAFRGHQRLDQLLAPL